MIHGKLLEKLEQLLKMKKCNLLVNAIKIEYDLKCKLYDEENYVELSKQ